MNYIFVIALLLYLVVFISIGILDIRNIKSFTDYSVAGKKQNTRSVVMTLLATVVGASTTIGITTSLGVPAVIMNYLIMIGMGLSLVLSLISVKRKEQKE